MIWQCLQATGEIYQGHFGEFTITRRDRLGVVIYRGSLVLAALCVAVMAIGVLCWGVTPWILTLVTVLFATFCLAFGVSLATIHIYLIPLHRLLQLCWLMGCVSAFWIGLQSQEPFAIAIYNHPLNLLGIGWIFVALAGLFFKEAFCFARLEAKLLTGLVPLLLLGHWLHGFSVNIEQVLLGINALLFLIFAIRKCLQPIPPDIGDKSVFTHLDPAH